MKNIFLYVKHEVWGDLKVINKLIVAATITLSIIAVIGCLILNFNEFLMGNPATLKNIIVTFVYLAIWILVLTIGIKIKNNGIVKYCTVIWVITLFVAILTICVNAAGVPASWAITFVILFLCQWYGINFFVRSFLVSSLIIALISLVMSAIAVISLNRIK